MSGFSQLGEVFEKQGAIIKTISTKPDRESLRGVGVYIIVDPDTIKENPNPNYIEVEDIKFLVKWVRKGGVLLLMANDGPNCEFTHMNMLAGEFGFQFLNKSLNPVLNRNWEMGAETNLPNHPVFKRVSKIYMKEVAPILISGKATPVLMDKDDIFIAETKFGKGYVLAFGDPWLYNEYIDHWLLPESFTNLKAAENLASWLIKNSARRK
jgi:unsaturated rhamnogalacturonyl hydrolase